MTPGRYVHSITIGWLDSITLGRLVSGVLLEFVAAAVAAAAAAAAAAEGCCDEVAADAVPGCCGDGCW
uniref:Putative secreted peptide n=1 Tax=Anopheles braziliensis TaxID=58242 RepID=A0A2M3ZT31_9DIPT